MILSPHKKITTPKSEVVIVIFAAWNFRQRVGWLTQQLGDVAQHERNGIKVLT